MSIKSLILTSCREHQENKEIVWKQTIERNGYSLDDFELVSENMLIPFLDLKVANILACSILGSFLSQEVIKAISRVGAPGFNVFVYDGSDVNVKAIPIK